MNFAVFFLDENGGKFETDLLDVSSSLEESVHTQVVWFSFANGEGTCCCVADTWAREAVGWICQREDGPVTC
jgi:hypothetical protein